MNKGDTLLMNALAREFRWSARRLMASPASTLAALVMLTLGIGSAVTVYTVDRAVLLDDLPLAQPNQLVTVQRSVGGGSASSMHSPADLLDLRAHRELFSAVSGAAGLRALLQGAMGPIYVNGASVTPDYFETFGATPLLGHTFLASNGQANVVVLSWRLWHSLFGGDTTIVNRTIQLDRKVYRVVGVMPKRLDFLQAELWVPGPGGIPQPPPAALGPELMVRRDLAYIDIVGRLRDGLDAEHAKVAMEAASQSIARNYLASAREVHFSITPLKTVVIGDAKTQLALLSTATALVFVLVCLSVAGLLVGRAMSRAHADAIKLALGAGLAQAVAGTVAEALVLASAGGVLGTLASVWGVRLLLLFAPAMQRSDEATLSASVVAFAVAAVIAAGLLASALPALRMIKMHRRRIVVSVGRRTQSPSRNLAWSSLVALQICFMVVLLVGSLMASRRLLQLRAIDLGFKPEGVLAGAVVPPDEGRSQQPAAMANFFNVLLARLADQGDIDAVGAASNVPMIRGKEGRSFSIVDDAGGAGSPPPDAWFAAVSPHYFDVLGMSMVAGRGFTKEDRYGTPPVAVVNRTMARRYWPATSPLGAQLRFSDGELVHVVGVVSDIRHGLLEVDAEPRVYRPYTQVPSPGLYVVLRSTVDVARIEPVIRGTIRELDPSLPLAPLSSLDASLQAALRPTQYLTVILGGFGVTALLISALGLYGLLRFRAQQEEYDVAIRLAIGAPRRVLIRTRVVGGMLIAASGIVLGMIVLIITAPLVHRVLPEMQHPDGAILLLVAFASGLVAALSSVIPACHVLTIDPSDVSRSS